MATHHDGSPSPASMPLPIPPEEISEISAIPALAQVALGVIANAINGGQNHLTIARSSGVSPVLIRRLVECGDSDRHPLRWLLLYEQILRGMQVRAVVVPNRQPQNAAELTLSARDPRQVYYQRIRQQGHYAITRLAKSPNPDFAAALSPFMRERLQQVEMRLGKPLAKHFSCEIPTLYLAVGLFANMLNLDEHMLPLISGCTVPTAHALLDGTSLAKAEKSASKAQKSRRESGSLRDGKYHRRALRIDPVSDAIFRILTSAGLVVELRRDNAVARIIPAPSDIDRASMKAGSKPGSRTRTTQVSNDTSDTSLASYAGADAPASLTRPDPLRADSPLMKSAMGQVTLGDVIARLRLGITMADVAREIGTSRQNVALNMKRLDYSPSFALTVRTAMANALAQGQYAVALAPEHPGTSLYLSLAESNQKDPSEFMRALRGKTTERLSMGELILAHNHALQRQVANRKLPEGWQRLEAFWFLGSKRGKSPCPIFGFAVAIETEATYSFDLLNNGVRVLIKQLAQKAGLPRPDADWRDQRPIESLPMIFQRVFTSIEQFTSA